MIKTILWVMWFIMVCWVAYIIIKDKNDKRKNKRETND